MCHLIFSKRRLCHRHHQLQSYLLSQYPKPAWRSLRYRNHSRQYQNSPDWITKAKFHRNRRSLDVRTIRRLNSPINQGPPNKPFLRRPVGINHIRWKVLHYIKLPREHYMGPQDNEPNSRVGHKIRWTLCPK